MQSDEAVAHPDARRLRGSGLYPRGRVAKEQESRHEARVLELQPRRVGAEHTALNGAVLEV
jgi:hypothetical protein